MAAALTPAQVARAAVEHGAAALDARMSGLFAVTPDGDLMILDIKGMDRGTLDDSGLVRRSDDGPVAHALRTRAPLWIESGREYAERWPAIAGRSSVGDAGRAMCALPLVV